MIGLMIEIAGCPACWRNDGEFGVTFSPDQNRARDLFRHECGATWLRGSEGIQSRFGRNKTEGHKMSAKIDPVQLGKFAPLAFSVCELLAGLLGKRLVACVACDGDGHDHEDQDHWCCRACAGIGLVAVDV